MEVTRYRSVEDRGRPGPGGLGSQDFRAGVSHDGLERRVIPCRRSSSRRSPRTFRRFLHCPGANATFRTRHVPDVAFAGARLFHFGYPPIMKGMCGDGGGELRTLFDRARDAGLATSLSPGTLKNVAFALQEWTQLPGEAIDAIVKAKLALVGTALVILGAWLTSRSQRAASPVLAIRGHQDVRTHEDLPSIPV